MVQLLYPYMNTGKTMTLTVWTFVGKVMSVLYNMLPGFVIAFLPRSKHLLIPWLQSLSTVILEPKKKVFHCFYFFPFCWLWSDGTRCQDLRFLSVEPQASFFTLIKRLFSFSLFAIKAVSSAYLRLLIFLLSILIPACDSSARHLIWCTLHII